MTNLSLGADAAITAPPQKLTIKSKLAYGVGDVSAAIAAQVTGFFLTAFLLDVSLVTAGAVSIILLISNVWDALNDPIVGVLSDRTRSRWGRRRPWLLFGAIPFGFAFMAQWIVPPLGPNGLFWYYLLATIVLKTCFTVVNVPYTALTPELTRNYDERTSLTSYRFAFSIMGGLLAVISFPFLRDLFGGGQAGYMAAGAILGAFMVIATLITFTYTKESPSDEHPTDAHAHIGPIEGVKIALQCRPFLMVVGIYMMSWSTVQFVQSNLVLYFRYWILNEDLFTPFVLVLQLTAFAFLPVWARVSHRYGKKTAYYIGVATFIPVGIGFFFLQPGMVLPVYVLAFFAGICVSMALLLPWSMLPDVVEYDEIVTGRRREGVFYGLFVFVQNMGLSLSLALSAWFLGLAGYVNPEVAGAFVEQPEAVLTTLRTIVSVAPIILLTISIPMAIAYPITRERFAEMRGQLAIQHEAGDA